MEVEREGKERERGRVKERVQEKEWEMERQTDVAYVSVPVESLDLNNSSNKEQLKK